MHGACFLGNVGVWGLVHVIRVPEDRLDAFEAALMDRAGQRVESPGKHERFRVRLGRWELVGYGSGKVVVLDEAVLPVVEEVLGEVLEAVEGTVVGSDEAGKGEWLGPLVVAACAVPSGKRASLVVRGVMDSKALSRDRVLAAAGEIEALGLVHEVVLVSPERFNTLFERFKAEGKNLNDLVAWAHAKALGSVLEALEAKGGASSVRIVVDEFDRVRTQARAQRAFDVEVYPVEQRVQAEDEVAVAAASVLAKAARERWVAAFEAREGVDVGSLSMSQARGHALRERFAKTRWLG